MKRDVSCRGLAITQVKERDQGSGLLTIGKRKLVTEGCAKTDASNVCFPLSAFGKTLPLLLASQIDYYLNWLHQIHNRQISNWV